MEAKNTRQFLVGQRPEFTKDLLNKNRKTVKMKVGFLSDSRRPNSHMYKVDLIKDVTYSQAKPSAKRKKKNLSSVLV